MHDNREHPRDAGMRIGACYIESINMYRVDRQARIPIHADAISCKAKCHQWFPQIMSMTPVVVVTYDIIPVTDTYLRWFILY